MSENLPEVLKLEPRPFPIDWEEIYNRIADGESVRSIAFDLGMPRRTLLDWLMKEERVQDYRVAMEARAHTHVDRIERLIEALERGEIEPNRARVAIDTHKWLAAKFYPKQFGTRQQADPKPDFSKEYVRQLRELASGWKPGQQAIPGKVAE